VDDYLDPDRGGFVVSGTPTNPCHSCGTDRGAPIGASAREVAAD